MIIKNEEKFIKDCLLSIYQVVSEIIIGDTGSIDHSTEIAKQYGAEIIQINWSNDFATARNQVLDRATQPYILVMDADERLSYSAIEELSKYVKSNTQDPGRVIIENKQDYNEINFGQVIRVFPNRGDYRFVGRIHEQLKYNNETPKSVQTMITIEHYGYLPEVIAERNKLTRNLNVLLEMDQENPNDNYTLYQIGKTYYVAKNYDKAIFYLSKVITSIYNCDMSKVPYASSAWLTICYSLYHMKDYQVLNNYINSGIDKFNDYTDLYFIYGLALTSMNHPAALEMIPSVFNHCLLLGEADPLKYETNKGVGSYKAHYNLGVYWEVAGNVESARTHYLLAANNGYAAAISRLKSMDNKETL